MGPLEGIRVVEMGGIGPVPFAAMVLAGLGADVVRVERPGAAPVVASESRYNVALRDRTAIVLDLKTPLAVEAVLRLAAHSDAFLEGWRPGVAERLGIGPSACAERNPRLVYGRMTGWGQDGPLSGTAGHDINYIALTGVLDAIGRVGERPVPPLNLVGDFGGGGMLLALGVLAGILEARTSGVGQVIDAAMVDGAAQLAAGFYGYVADGTWSLQRGTNLLDSGAPFYDVYETSDGRHMAVGAIESRFYAELLRGLGIDGDSLPHQLDRAAWPELRRVFSEAFRTRSRAEWAEVFANRDACVTPVLSFGEAPQHEHSRFRDSYVEVDGIRQPAPAPRFSRTPASTTRPPRAAGADTPEILNKLGFDEQDIRRLRVN